MTNHQTPSSNTHKDGPACTPQDYPIAARNERVKAQLRRSKERREDICHQSPLRDVPVVLESSPTDNGAIEPGSGLNQTEASPVTHSGYDEEKS